MRWLIRRCDKCLLYTLREKCPQCGLETRSPHPAKFSPSDKYVIYRAYEGKRTNEYMRERRQGSTE